MAYLVGGTTVIDQNRNLTNVSGAGISINNVSISHPVFSSFDSSSQQNVWNNHQVGKVVSGLPTGAQTVRTFSYSGLASAYWNINSSTNYSTSGPHFSSFITTPGGNGYTSLIYALWFYDNSTNQSTILKSSNTFTGDGDIQQTITEMRTNLGAFQLAMREVSSGDRLVVTATNSDYWGGTTTFRSTFATFTISEVQ